MKHKVIYSIIIGFQLLALLALVISREYTLRRGQVVTLEVLPIDPRSLMRGDYLIINYKISTIEKYKLVTDGTDVRKGDRIYVTLEKRGEFWEAVNGFRYRNRIPSGVVALKGRIKSIMKDRIGIDYGIESYFIPEGYRLPRGKISAEVAVNGSYQGVIKNILVDGKVIDLSR